MAMNQLISANISNRGVTMSDTITVNGQTVKSFVEEQDHPEASSYFHQEVHHQSQSAAQLRRGRATGSLRRTTSEVPAGKRGVPFSKNSKPVTILKEGNHMTYWNQELDLICQKYGLMKPNQEKLEATIKDGKGNAINAKKLYMVLVMRFLNKQRKPVNTNAVVPSLKAYGLKAHSMQVRNAIKNLASDHDLIQYHTKDSKGRFSKIDEPEPNKVAYVSVKRQEAPAPAEEVETVSPPALDPAENTQTETFVPGAPVPGGNVDDAIKLIAACREGEVKRVKVGGIEIEF